MAPEIVFRQLEGLKPQHIVLDPMSGSGTVLRAASELGHRAIGFDLDPLAVLMARVWTTSCRTDALQDAALEVVERARRVTGERLRWIDDCEETEAYVRFWFCKKQIRALRRLTSVLVRSRGPLAEYNENRAQPNHNYKGARRFNRTGYLSQSTTSSIFRQ